MIKKKTELVKLIPPQLLSTISPFILPQDNDLKTNKKDKKKSLDNLLFCKNANISVCHFLCDDDTFGGEKERKLTPGQ